MKSWGFATFGIVVALAIAWTGGVFHGRSIQSKFSTQAVSTDDANALARRCRQLDRKDIIPCVQRALIKNERAAALRLANDLNKNDVGCERGREDRRSDLCAQWKAADAADRSAYYALLQFWGGMLTLASAIVAVFFSWRAAHAAESALQHEKAISTIQLRPWLTFDLRCEKPVQVDVVNGELMFWFDISATATNTGATVATSCKLDLKIFNAASIENNSHTVSQAFYQDMIDKRKTGNKLGTVVAPGNLGVLKSSFGHEETDLRKDDDRDFMYLEVAAIVTYRGTGNPDHLYYSYKLFSLAELAVGRQNPDMTHGSRWMHMRLGHVPNLQLRPLPYWDRVE